MALRTGRVIIAKNIKLDKDYNDVLTYSESDMLNLVIQNKIAESSNCSFVKVGENTIDTPFSYGDALKSNYMALQNPNYSNKWFFCFVNKVEYISNRNTRIYYTVDEFSTWYDYWTKEDCFVIREHVNDDTIGKHTIPENLETGEFVINSFDYTGLDNSHLVIASSWNPFARGSSQAGYTGDMAGSYLNGIYQGCDYFLIGDTASLGNSDPQAISYFMGVMATQSKLDSVLGMFMIPDELTNFSNITWDYMINNNGLAQYPYKKLTNTIVGNGAVSMLTKTITKNYTSLNGYRPKNNKLFTSEFNYLLVSNNSGNNFTYNYEDFSTNDCSFDVKGVITPGGAIKCYPKNYRGITNGVEYGINSGKYPICSFTGDMYINWLTQNSVNIQAGNFEFNIKPGDLGMASGGLGIAGGVGLLATGGGGFAGAGSILSGISNITNSVKEQQYHEKMPPMFKGNVNTGDLMFSMKWLDFNFYKMSVKYEYARIVDDYFQKYGYKINRIKSPNLTGRTNYNYVLIGTGENIGYPTGNKYVPAESMEIINNIFRRGVTLWHNHANLGDYSVTNNIVS